MAEAGAAVNARRDKHWIVAEPKGPWPRHLAQPGLGVTWSATEAPNTWCTTQFPWGNTSRRPNRDATEARLWAGCRARIWASGRAATAAKRVRRFSPMYVSGPYHTVRPGT